MSKDKETIMEAEELAVWLEGWCLSPPCPGPDHCVHGAVAGTVRRMASLLRAAEDTPEGRPAAENVPLTDVFGRVLPGQVTEVVKVDGEKDAWAWSAGAGPWRNLPVRPDGTVTVEAES